MAWYNNHHSSSQEVNTLEKNVAHKLLDEQPTCEIMQAGEFKSEESVVKETIKNSSDLQRQVSTLTENLVKAKLDPLFQPPAQTQPNLIHSYLTIHLDVQPVIIRQPPSQYTACSLQLEPH